MALKQHLITAYFTLHVVLLLWQSTPAAPTPKQWEWKSTKVLLRNWNRTLKPLGITQKPDDVRALVQPITQAYRSVRWPVVHAMNQHINPLLGTRQGWAMFGNIRHSGARLLIEVKENGEWKTIYLARSNTFHWNRRVFDEERARAMLFSYGLTPVRSRPMAHWLVPKIKTDFPEASRMRTSFVIEQHITPEQMKRGDKKPATRKLVLDTALL